MPLSHRNMVWVFLLILIFTTYLIFWFARHEKSSLGTSSISSEHTLTTYSDPGWGFSLQVPADYQFDNLYRYTLLPGKEIEGISFSVPSVFTVGTNLSLDSKISIEIFPGIFTCSTTVFFSGTTTETLVNENGVDYFVSHRKGAAAGNIYEETVYALSDQTPCVGVRYFIHSSNIQNYEPGTRQEFNREHLLKEFDAIRHSLILPVQM